MSSPYSGATPAGATRRATRRTADPTPQNYAADYSGDHRDARPPRPVVPTSRAPRSAQLIGEVTKDLSTLMRQELELAKVEVKAEAKKAGQGAGMFGAAGFAGYMVLLFLSIALWWALSHLVGHSWSALIVAVLWGIVGAVAVRDGQEEVPAGQPEARAHRRDPAAGARRPQAQLTTRPRPRSRRHDQQ